MSGGLLSSLLSGQARGISLTDKLVWSWRSLRQSLFMKKHLGKSLLVMVFVVLLYGLSLWPISAIYGESSGVSDWLDYGLAAGVSLGLSSWVWLGLFEGVSSETIGDQHRVVSNQGIRRSARHGLVLGLISAGIAWLVTGLIAAGYGWTGWLITALCVGLLAGLLNGGLAALRHYLVRFLLWRTHRWPWALVPVLDEAAERILLRKVGGGYVFVHRLLLDYFANLENGTSSVAESRQESPSSDTKPSKSAEPTGADEHSVVPTAPLAPPLLLSEGSRLLPCGHEQRTPNARFCSVCGVPIQSSSLK